MLSPKRKKAVELLAEGKQTRKEIAKCIGVHPDTLGRWLKTPEFLQACHEAFQLRQCQDLQKLHQMVQVAYKEIFHRLSDRQFSEVPLGQLVQMLDRLNRQIESIGAQLERLSQRQSVREHPRPALLSEEEYHEVAQTILQKIAERHTPKPPESGAA